MKKSNEYYLITLPSSFILHSSFFILYLSSFSSFELTRPSVFLMMLSTTQLNVGLLRLYMPEFIFMLTCDDRTVDDALATCHEIRDTGLQYVGFKDIGLPIEQLRELAAAISDGGQKVVFEVVSERKEDELRAARAAIDIGVDYLLGGTQARDVVEILAGSGIRYFPFPGRVIGHPSKLYGSISEIVDSARRLAAVEGVDGLDLLAYRYDGDVAKLVQSLVSTVETPVIAAGGIDSDEKIESLTEAGVWGFTIGSAIFNRTYPVGGASVREKVGLILQFVRSRERREDYERTIQLRD
jgi:hypothetical protein